MSSSSLPHLQVSVSLSSVTGRNQVGQVSSVSVSFSCGGSVASWVRVSSVDSLQSVFSHLCSTVDLPSAKTNNTTATKKVILTALCYLLLLVASYVVHEIA